MAEYNFSEKHYHTREIDELMKVRREILGMNSISGRNRKIGGSRYVSEEQELNLR